MLINIKLDLGDKKYSLIIDESTDISTIKYLCLCIRYYSDQNKRHIVDFLGLVVVESSLANELYKCIKEFLASVNIRLTSLIGIGTDGGSNLCGCKNSVYTLLRTDIPNLKLIRCVCHSLNNAASKAAEELPASVEFLCREIFNWFNNSSTRKINFKRLFDLINTNENRNFHEFVKLSTTRWLARYSVVNVILDQWLELKTHFDMIIGKEKCYTSRLLCEMLNDDVNYLYFKFVKPVLLECKI